MDTMATCSGSGPLAGTGTPTRNLKQKNNIDCQWGDAHEGAGRKKKKLLSSALQLQPFARLVGPSTQTPSSNNSDLPLTRDRLATAAVSFFAPRPPSVYQHQATTSLDVNDNQADAESPQGVRIVPEQGVLSIYVFLIPES